jgi:hypothetical protein
MSSRRHSFGMVILATAGAPYLVGYWWPTAGIVLFLAALPTLVGLAIVAARERKAPHLGATLVLLWCAVLAPVGFKKARDERIVAEGKRLREEGELAEKRERRASIVRENEERASEIAALRQGHGAVLCMDSSYAPARCSCRDMHGCCVDHGGVARCEQD